MAQVSDVFPVYDLANPQKKEVGRVVLNGYKIENENPLGFEQGMMRSFKVISGNLWDCWDRQDSLELHTENGQTHLIRIAALPVDHDSFGLVEFL